MIDNQLRHVELWPNRDFIHPHAVFEHLDPTIPVHKRKIRGVHSAKMCYYLGKVRGVENSSVSISTCDGLVSTKKRDFNMFLTWKLEHFVLR